jgi:lytic murein transglycosylase
MARLAGYFLPRAAVATLAVLVPLAAATAQSCGNGPEGFERWLAAYKSRAAAQGLSQGAISRGLEGVGYDARVIRLDRGQRSFKLSFEQFYARRVSSSMIRRGQGIMAQRRALFSDIERRYGVPASILVAIWGLETNFGGDGDGKFSIVQSLATLAYDCRRSAFFENELTSALRIIDRGDISVERMRGGWAGEIGPMQFLPSSYIKYAVDADGDRRRDLFGSVPDMLSSTANYLKQKGWRAGEPWGEGTHNHNVIREWNKAEVYVKTIAVMAERLGGSVRAQK